MEKLTIARVQEIVRIIDENKTDPESSHSLEDDLYCEFIEGISKDLYDPSELKELATEILKTKEISFERWCA